MSNHTDNSDNSGNASNRQPDSDLLALAATRAARWPHLFARVITRYLEFNKLNEQELCSRLDCDLDTLNHLRLCGRPDKDPGSFSLDIQRVAEKLGLDMHFLASMVREVDAVDAFQASKRDRKNAPFSSMSSGMLRAARDHERPLLESEKEAEGAVREEQGTLSRDVENTTAKNESENTNDEG